MVRGLTHNDTVECIQLMNKYSYHAHYQRDEAMWIQHLINHIVEYNKGNPHFLAIGDFNSDGYLDGFMLCGSFKNYYNQQFVMDVKDCILEEESRPLHSAIRLFNYMIEHTKKHGGIHWRADSIRGGEMGEKYCKFLVKKYGAVLHHNVRGIIT